MLFILYVSDLQDHLPSSIGWFQYADDTTIYSSCPAPELQRCAQELNLLHTKHWAHGLMTPI